MASSSNEVTAKFRVDTSEFTQEIKSANSTLSTLRSEMKLNEAQFKNSGDKVEYLQKKSELLKKELDANREKQEALNQKIEVAKRYYGDNSEEVQRLTRQLNATKTEEQNLVSATNQCEQEMKELERSADGAEGELEEMAEAADDAGDAAEGSGEGWTKLGGVLSDLASNAIQSIISGLKDAAKEALEAGMSFESAMDEVGAISGGTTEQMTRLSKKAKDLGKNTKFSASEVASAYKYMGMAGWDAGQMIEGVDGILQLAAASGTDLAETSDIVTDGLTAFGMSAEESGHFADVLAKASVTANTDVKMMGETFKYAGPVCGSLGVSLEDAAIATGLMANSGIKASQAGTALRTGLTNLIKPSTQAANAMAKYGIEVQKNEDGTVNLSDTMVHLREKLGALEPTERAAATAAIFGKNAMSGWSAIITATDEDFTKLTEAMGKSNGAAKEMSDIMQGNLKGAVTTFGSAAEGLGIAFYEMISGPATEAVKTAAGLLNSLTDAIAPAQSNLDLFISSTQASVDNAKATLEGAQKTWQNALAEAGVLEEYRDRLIELNEKHGELNDLEQYEMDFLIDQLAAKIPGLTEAYDKNRHVLNLTNGELTQMFENQEALVLVNAAEQYLTDTTSALIEAEVSHKMAVLEQERALEQLKDKGFRDSASVVSTYADGLGGLDKETRNLIKTYMDATKTVNESSATLEDCRTEYDSTRASVEAIKKEYEGQAKEQKEVQSSAESMSRTVSNSMDELEDGVGAGTDSVEDLSEAVEDLDDTCDDFDGGDQIEDSITDGLDSSSDAVEQFCNDTEKQFANMQLKMPDVILPKLPTFGLSTATKTVGGKTYTYPSGIDVISWHAKAMQNGMILNGPTIFGYNQRTGRFLGGGEVGSETVVGTDSLLNMIQRSVEASAPKIDYDKLARKITDAFGEVDFSMNIDGRKFGRLVRSVN